MIDKQTEQLKGNLKKAADLKSQLDLMIKKLPDDQRKAFEKISKGINKAVQDRDLNAMLKINSQISTFVKK